MSVDKFEKRTLIRKLTLPSQGKLYPDLPTGEVRIATISSREDKIFAGSGNSAAAKLDLVLDRCIDAGPLSPDDLLLADRLFCLFHIRSLSYGDKYSFEIRCGECSRKRIVSVDLLTDLKVTNAPDDLKEPYEVTLPHSGRRLGLRFFRGRDEKEIAKFVERSAGAPAEEGDPAYFYRMSRHIASIDGHAVIPGSIETLEIVQNLEGPDAMAFRNALDKTPFGFDLTFPTTCPACNETAEVGVPFSIEFFRPKS